MYRLLTLISLFIFIGACASVSNTNKISKANIVFNTGVYKDQSWDDDLVFKRTSWYREAKLAHDVLITKIDFSSPFAKWFGKDEKDLQNKCKEFYVALFFSGNQEPVSAGRVISEIRGQGLTEIVVPEFKDNLSSHYVYIEWNFETYRVTGFCQKSELKLNQGIDIVIPGFLKTNLLEK